MYKQNGKGKLRFSQMYKPLGPVSGTGQKSTVLWGFLSEFFCSKQALFARLFSGYLVSLEHGRMWVFDSLQESFPAFWETAGVGSLPVIISCRSVLSHRALRLFLWFGYLVHQPFDESGCLVLDRFDAF